MPATCASIAKRCRTEAGDALAGPLLVFADDWARHPSSCQHLVRHLLGGPEVYWVNTIGTRPPGFNRGTLGRGLEKLRHWIGNGGNARYSRGPRVINPRMWPWQDAAFGRPLNRELLLRQLTPLLRALPETAIAVTTLPVVADLVGRLPVRRWVYYCVDDFGAWPGLDGDNLRRLEERLVARADVLIAASHFLRAKLQTMGRCAHLLTHGVDLKFWQSPAPAPKALEMGLPRPWVVFWGLVDRRMDVEFLARLGEDMQNGSIVLAGPEAGPDPALVRLPRVRRIGVLPYEQLPGLARAADALIMPYVDRPVTRAMQPLKLNEYLATGKPVIARDLPATRPWGDCLDLAGTPGEFSEMVRRRLRSGTPDPQASARRRLVDDSWAAKALVFDRLIRARAPYDDAKAGSGNGERGLP